MDLKRDRLYQIWPLLLPGNFFNFVISENFGEFSNKIAKVVEFLPRKNDKICRNFFLPGYQKLPSGFWFQPRLKRSTVLKRKKETPFQLQEQKSFTYSKEEQKIIHHTESEFIHHCNLRCTTRTFLQPWLKISSVLLPCKRQQVTPA
jgi:hypothetical protein